MVPWASLSELEAAGQHYCEDHWDALKNQHNEIDEPGLSKYCFSSAYMVALMHDVLGVSMEEKRYGNYAFPDKLSKLKFVLCLYVHAVKIKPITQLQIVKV